MAFRIQIVRRRSDFDDSFYFKHFPNRVQLLEAIERNKRIADEGWEYDYSQCMKGIENLQPFPDNFSPRLAYQGFPLSEDCSIGIWQFKFEEFKFED